MAKPAAINTIVDQAYEALNRADLVQARRLMTNAEQKAPRDRAVQLLKAVVQLQEDKPDLALQTLDAALKIHRDDVMLLMTRASVLLDYFDDHVESAEILDSVIAGLTAEEPKSVDDQLAHDMLLGQAWTLLAGCHLEADRREEALDAAQNALEHQPDDGGARLAVAHALFEVGRPQEAEAATKSALQLEDHNPDAHWLCARIQTSLGNHHAADEAIARAVALDPSRFHAATRVPPEDFGIVVRGAVRELPAEMQSWFKRIRIEPHDVPSTELLAQGVGPSALSHCPDPPPDLSSVTDLWSVAPLQILLFRRNFEIASENPDDLRDLVGTALVQEAGRFLGLDQDVAEERFEE